MSRFSVPAVSENRNRQPDHPTDGPNRCSLRAAWHEFLAGLNPTHAVTFAYNNRYNGSTSPCYRVRPNDERILVRGSGRRGYKDNRFPTIRHVGLPQVHADLHRLHRDVDRRLFGSHFNRPGSQRTSFAGFVENLSENIHVHTGWTVPSSRTGEFERVIRDAWLASSRYVSIKIELVRDEGWAKYICKNNEALEGDAALFVSDPISHA